MNLPKLSTKVMPDNSEIIPYDEAGIPLYVQYKYLSAYLNSRALCHWHEDMEFSYVKKGEWITMLTGKYTAQGKWLYHGKRQTDAL